MINRSSSTGGRLCVRGILHQMLSGLAHGMSLVVRGGRFEDAGLTSVLLVLEPAAGGDLQIHVDGTRVVEQIKIRTNGQAWTAGQIAGEVLPDLLLAVCGDDVPTRYRFSTDGALDCDDLVRLCAALRGRPAPSDVIADLDDEDGRAFKYDAWMSEREYFKRLAGRAGCKDLGRFRTLLVGLEIVGDQHDADVREDIDSFLVDLVDAREDVAAKRDQLVGMMMRLAEDGAERTLASLLAEADLPVERTLHLVRLPEVTSAALDRQLELIGYDPDHDVREPSTTLPLGLSLISGASGYGKTWRMAAELRRRDRAGMLTVWVGNATDLESVRRRIVEVVWHSSFDRDQSIPGLQRRLGSRYLDGEGAWLTVGVDDVQSGDLLEEMRAADWGAYGIRLLTTVPERLARSAAAKPLAPPVCTVERFSHGDLRRFLASHGRDLRALPDDVVDLLRTPIFAELYRRIDNPAWAPADEYALVDRFWLKATYEARDMADYQDDPSALVRLASTLLTKTGRYPWSPGAARTSGLDQSARGRLAASGMLRQSEAGSQIIHDRVLNWAVALFLAEGLAAGTLDTEEAVAAVVATDRSETLAPGIGSRLGYVPLDFLWLAADMADGASVAAVIAGLVSDPDRRSGARALFEEHLVGLGPRMLPALKVLATMQDDVGTSVPGYAARAIGAIGAANPGAADGVIRDLLSDPQDERAVRAALAAAALAPSPRQVERIWDVHVSRRIASDAASHEDVDLRQELFRRRCASWNALVAAVGAEPTFVEDKLARMHDPLSAELLLDLLLEVDHERGVEIWWRVKDSLLARVPIGHCSISKAIGRFGDAAEAVRLERVTPSAGWHEPRERFAALARLDARRAAAHLPCHGRELASGPYFPLARLLRNGGDGVAAALRDLHADDWRGMADLADLYRDDHLLIDQQSFIAIISAFEGRLEEVGGGPWRPQREVSLLRFLSLTSRPDLLAILETYRGSRFERLLRDRALAHGRRKTLWIDPDATSCERLLLAIGGTAYGAAAAAALTDAAPTSRVDGCKAVMKLPRGSAFASDLGKAVDDQGRSEFEEDDLMVALAVHGMDSALYDLVMSTSLAHLEAIDVRRTMGPWPTEIDRRIRADLRSPVDSTRIGATCALAFAPPADVSSLLAETLARCPDDDPSALTVVRMASHLRVYEPGMLEQLKRMASLPADGARGEVVCYLAEHGDEKALAAVTSMLREGVVGSMSDAMLRAAYALTDRNPADPIGMEKLATFVEKHFGIYPVGLIAQRLAERGAIAEDVVVDLGYAGRRLSAADVFFLVERVALKDRDEARAILERRFDQAPSAGSARQILELGGPDAIDHLIAAYRLTTPHEVRWIISRALRRHAARGDLLTRLCRAARSDMPSERVVAAEILGWIPGAEAEQMLSDLAHDRHPDVSDAAIAAEGRQRSEICAKALMAEIPAARHLGKWSRLWALTEVADPFLLDMDGDGLAIETLVAGLGEIFAIWTRRTLAERKKALIKGAEVLDRRL